MLWLYRIQQRLSITPAEGAALLISCGALISGLAVRQIQAHGAPSAAALLEDGRLAAIDSVSAAVRAAAPPESLRAGPAAAVDGPPAPRQRPRRGRAGLPAPASIAINTATAAQLERLPRIGPALAARIVEHRAANGPFQSIEGLDAVRGIGPRMLEQIRPYVTL
jgi:competence ComEA-like helix-hairpin-helix protein